MKSLRIYFGLLLLGFTCLASAASASVLTGSSEGMPYKVSQVAEGLSVPWGMALIDNTHILLTERQGTLKLLNRFTGKVSAVSGAPKVLAQGQGGLLDVAVPPSFKPGDWIYFTYSKPVDGEGATTLARAHFSDKRVFDWQDIIVTKSVTSTSRHYGSRIAFDSKGHVYFSVGDRGERPNGQDLQTHAGSILRLTLDGSVPEDKPFNRNKNALPEIWSYGHRNPQGLAFDAATNRLWAIEHGPRGGDEINLIQPGLNYGWATITYGKEYWGPFQVGEGTEKAGMEPPVKYYVPSIAPGSLVVYRGKAFPKWQGNLIAGALKLTHLNRIELNETGEAVKEERLLEALGERIRALLVSPEGWLYFSTDSGKVFKLSNIE